MDSKQIARLMDAEFDIVFRGKQYHVRKEWVARDEAGEIVAVGDDSSLMAEQIFHKAGRDG